VTEAPEVTRAEKIATIARPVAVDILNLENNDVPQRDAPKIKYKKGEKEISKEIDFFTYKNFPKLYILLALQTDGKFGKTKH